jgi:hypothetical protein
MTVIEIRPHRQGWKAFEAPGVEPVFPKKDQAIDYGAEPCVLSLWRDSHSELKLKRVRGAIRETHQLDTG